MNDQSARARAAAMSSEFDCVRVSAETTTDFGQIRVIVDGDPPAEFRVSVTSDDLRRLADPGVPRTVVVKEAVRWVMEHHPEFKIPACIDLHELTRQLPGLEAELVRCLHL